MKQKKRVHMLKVAEKASLHTAKHIQIEVKKFKKRSVSRRESVQSLSKRLQVPLSTLHDLISRRTSAPQALAKCRRRESITKLSKVMRASAVSTSLKVSLRSVHRHSRDVKAQRARDKRRRRKRVFKFTADNIDVIGLEALSQASRNERTMNIL
jgi:hypothetical protein